MFNYSKQTKELEIMNKKFLYAGIFLTGFATWTWTLLTIDIAQIGPLESAVGLSTLNQVFHDFTGVHMELYRITDLLSILPIGIVMFFGALGLTQWFCRKKIVLVDFDILVLGGFYAVVAALFVFFEIFVVNYRPVLIEDILEASYPSSTTMLVMCVMPTAMMQANWRMKNSVVKDTLICLMGCFTIFMVLARMISGVHWLTDILGGALLSAGLVILYDAVCSFYKKSSL